MPFNYEKLVELHRRSGETQTDFSRAIFNDSKKMELKYFDRQSISTRHLEALSLHYNVPMETFFDCPGLPSVCDASPTHGQSAQSVGFASDKVALLEQQLSNAHQQISYLQQQCQSLTEILHSVTVGTQKS